MSTRHRLVALAGGVVAAAVSIGCTRDAADAQACANAHRLPSNDVQVMFLDPAPPGGSAPTARPAVACSGLACLRNDREVVVVAQPDGALWGAWAGEAGRVVSDGNGALVGEVPANVVAFTEIVRARGLPSDGSDRKPATDLGLLEGQRTCGSTNAGGGHAFHVIQNDGDVWQRLHWTTPPQSDEVRALPKDAYPLVIGAAGTLCGWATQKTPRHWQVHAPSGVVVATAPNREHPPAHCINTDVVAIDAGDHVVHLARDGTVTKKDLPKNGASAAVAPTYDPVMALGGASSSNRPEGTLRIADTSFSRPLVATMDLAGRPLPAGAVRRRIAAAGDGARFVVLSEKIELVDCSTRELVHLVDTAAPGGIVTNVRDADVVIAKLASAAGRFWWLEATPQIVDVGG